MPLDKQIKKISIFVILILLLILSFLVVKPILLSILAGLILAYTFNPLYKKLLKVFRERNTSALAICLLIVLVIFIPLWFLIPIMMQQAFSAFTLVQSIDIAGFVERIFPTAAEQFKQDMTGVIWDFVGDLTSSTISTLIGFLLNLPSVLLNLAVLIFVFFFSLRDQDKLKAFVSEISPFAKEKQELLIKHFKGITSSIIFGYILVGLIQGVLLGVGLLIFGVPNALVLTLFAIFASILPVIGPWLVWIPVAIYLLSTGQIGVAIGFILYSAILVSSIDNIIRPYIVSRKTGISSAVVLVGMIGGLFVFGILGIILGPLILGYLILFLEAYRNKSLSKMFLPH